MFSVVSYICEHVEWLCSVLLCYFSFGSQMKEWHSLKVGSKLVVRFINPT